MCAKVKGFQVGNLSKALNDDGIVGGGDDDSCGGTSLEEEEEEEDEEEEDLLFGKFQLTFSIICFNLS